MRIELESVGQLPVDDSAYYGIQTACAKQNFRITESKMNGEFIKNIA